MINDGKKKMGFNDQFRAFNINISDPDTERKWSTLQQIVKDYTIEASNIYQNNSAFARMTQISTVIDMPDKLMEFGKSLQAFIESTDAQKIKADKKITKIVEVFATTAKLSHDQRILDAAIDISNALIAIKKGM